MLLQRTYGKKEIECVTSVKQLFSRYDITKRFLTYEETTYQKVKELIASDMFPDQRLVPVLQLLTQKLFGKA